MVLLQRAFPPVLRPGSGIREPGERLAQGGLAPRMCPEHPSIVPLYANYPEAPEVGILHMQHLAHSRMSADGSIKKMNEDEDG